MAASSTVVNFACNTDAIFRAWGLVVSNAIAAGGWVQTSDTGQINWATATAPVSGSPSGYEIWRSNDAGGGLNEIYVKIEYGSPPNTAVVLSGGLWITVGWASDGAGNLSGAVIGTRLYGAGNNGTSSPSIFNLASGSGYLMLVLGNNSNKSCNISVERLKNTLGQSTNDILVMAGQNASGTGSLQVVASDIAYPAETGNPPAGVIMPTAANAIQNTVVGLGMVFGSKAGLSNPSINMFGCNVGQLGMAQGIIQITDVFGVAHTYIVNNSVVQGGAPFLQGTLTNLLSRYE